MTDPLERLFGCGDIDSLFAGHLRVPAPWPRVPRRKHEPFVDTDMVAALLAKSIDLVDVDPRLLWSSQGWVVRHHAAYYRTGEWERTGRTSADQWLELNAFPVVVERRERWMIVAGHHRATAALIEGRPLRVRVAAGDGQCAVTPLLYVDHQDGVDPDRARSLVVADQRTSVRSLEAAGDVLRSLDVPHDDVRRRLEATSRRLDTTQVAVSDLAAPG